MKTTTLALLSAATLGVATSAQAGVISSNAEPTTDVLIDEIDGGGVSTLINASAAQGARGTFFNVGAAGSFDVSGFTLQAQNGATFSAGQDMTVAVFSGTPTTFAAPGSFANVTPGYLVSNAGLTLIGSETFDMETIAGDAAAGTIGGQGYVTFDLASDITVDGNTDYMVMFFSNFAFSQREGTGNGGGRIQFRETKTELTASGSRDMRYLVHGVPEPGSLALLGLGGLLIARRRRG